MSRMLPDQSVSALRQYSSLAIDLWGIDCVVYRFVNQELDQQEMDIYQELPGEGGENVYEMIKTKVWIEWSPSVSLLRKYSLYTEHDIPMLAFLPSHLDLTKKSYFTIDIKYVPSGVHNENSFELVDQLNRGVHDAIVLSVFKIAPLRRSKPLKP